MKIIFYNTAHVGDTIFAQPLVKEFCKQNPDCDVSVFVKQNWFFYYDIPNIKIIGNDLNEYTNFDRHNPYIIINNDNYKKKSNYFNSLKHNLTYFKENDIIYINTWISNGYIRYDICSCDLEKLFNGFSLMFNDINRDFNTNFKFECPYPKLLTIPVLDISFFLDFKKDKKIIYYYNDIAHSGHDIPIRNHDYIIDY